MPNRTLIHDPKKGWLLFKSAVRHYCVHHLDEVMPALEEIEALVNLHHYYAAGWVSYEASSAFDTACITHQADDFPLIDISLFEECEILAECPQAPWQSSGLALSSHQLPWQLSETQSDYFLNIQYIRDQIGQGNTYQVNYTIKQQADLNAYESICPWSLFKSFANQARYSAYLENSNYAISSSSPELFFRLDGQQLKAKPMKGTSHRGRTQAEDQSLHLELQQSEKNRAENLMIVDMIRNDIGHVAMPGSVKVNRLFELEAYPTVWQMTSTVEAQTQASFSEIFKALFPCASITGAPKVSTMKIINALEKSPRRLYTGAIGYFTHQADQPRQAMFNVAIRTLLHDKLNKTAEYGIGGGIIWDSEAQSEYDECLLKAQAILKPRPN